jgi:hypothetical protein
MNNQLALQLEFQEKASQYKIENKRKPTIFERKQRISLALEELCELAVDGYGLEISIIEMLQNKIVALNKNLLKKHPIQDSEIYNEEATLDATIDIAVINNGTIICNGHQNIFDREYENVSENNLTKFTKSIDVAQETIKFYENKGKKGLEIYSVKYAESILHDSEVWYGIKDTNNFGKIMKLFNYETVQLNLNLY